VGLFAAAGLRTGLPQLMDNAVKGARGGYSRERQPEAWTAPPSAGSKSR